MPTFIMTANLTQQSMQGMIDKPEDRRAALGALFTATGATLKDLYFTAGERDILMIVESDDPNAAVAAAMVAGASGAGTGLQTVRAWTPAEFAEIAKKAGAAASSYRKPGD
ncbi:GYD domain-containing protein [Fluviibacterium sp. DFM31]|uniref:GYD domain-containing protein n=1 Tax=Meridianimarinicoccus marinus TaxID=3231483 RepID=A0ABV3L7X8_9RHOB